MNKSVMLGFQIIRPIKLLPWSIYQDNKLEPIVTSCCGCVVPTGERESDPYSRDQLTALSSDLFNICAFDDRVPYHISLSVWRMNDLHLDEENCWRWVLFLQLVRETNSARRYGCHESERDFPVCQMRTLGVVWA